MMIESRNGFTDILASCWMKTTVQDNNNNVAASAGDDEDDGAHKTGTQ